MFYTSMSKSSMSRESQELEEKKEAKNLFPVNNPRHT